jgi:hypothetical protein
MTSKAVYITGLYLTLMDCVLVESDQYFIALMMEAVSISETSADFHHTTWYIKEESHVLDKIFTQY